MLELDFWKHTLFRPATKQEIAEAKRIQRKTKQRRSKK